MVKVGVDMLTSLDLYIDCFETSYIQITKDYYSVLSFQKLEVLSPADYVLYVQELIQTESKLTSMYLSDRHSFRKVIETMESIMII